MARDGDEQQPMTSERLAAIKTRMEAIPGSIFVTTQKELSQTFFDRNELVEAMEVMLAREAALLAVVRAVANQDYAQDIDDPEWMQCLACGGGGPTGETIEHHETCYYVKARAVLASADERSGGDGA